MKNSVKIYTRKKLHKRKDNPDNFVKLSKKKYEKSWKVMVAKFMLLKTKQASSKGEVKTSEYGIPVLCTVNLPVT